MIVSLLGPPFRLFSEQKRRREGVGEGERETRPLTPLVFMCFVSVQTDEASHLDAGSTGLARTLIDHLGVLLWLGW